uniref:WD_REPEATS_REGION domain-containing protein n=1 Tax=Schistosoma curassoni TaxID=6186 RepID=A0A183JFS7_9TREM
MSTFLNDSMRSCKIPSIASASIGETNSPVLIASTNGSFSHRVKIASDRLKIISNVDLIASSSSSST